MASFRLGNWATNGRTSLLRWKAGNVPRQDFLVIASYYCICIVVTSITWTSHALQTGVIPFETKSFLTLYPTSIKTNMSLQKWKDNNSTYSQSILKRQIERGLLRLLVCQRSHVYALTLCCNVYIFARNRFEILEINNTHREIYIYCYLITTVWFYSMKKRELAYETAHVPDLLHALFICATWPW